MIEHDFYNKVKLNSSLISKRTYGNSSLKWRLVNPFEAVQYLQDLNKGVFLKGKPKDHDSKMFSKNKLIIGNKHMKSFETKKNFLIEKPYKINEMTITTQKFLKKYDEPKKTNIEWIKNLQDCIINKQKSIQLTNLKKKKLLKIDLRKSISQGNQHFLKQKPKEDCHFLRNSVSDAKNPKIFQSLQNNIERKKDFLLVFPEKIYIKT